MPFPSQATVFCRQALKGRFSRPFSGRVFSEKPLYWGEGLSTFNNSNTCKEVTGRGSHQSKMYEGAFAPPVVGLFAEFAER